MKNNLLALVVVTIAAGSNAFGIWDPQWERPVMESNNMEITEARFGFEDLERADLVLTQRDGSSAPTGMKLTLENSQSNTPTVIWLEVVHVEPAGCGSIRYVANLPTTKTKKAMGKRFSVNLVDHTHRLCMDKVAGQWEASIRSGYGFCGTMDSTASLTGIATAVYTIQ